MRAEGRGVVRGTMTRRLARRAGRRAGWQLRKWRDAAAANLASTHPALVSSAVQRGLQFQYAQLVASGAPLPSFEDVGFRVFSQQDDDGILLYLFSVIGVTDRVCVELAFGSPVGANTTNLICNLGWRGILIEGEPDLARSARSFFETHPDTWIHPPDVVEAWIGADDLDPVLSGFQLPESIDLLSLDVDGIDWWIWRGLQRVRPRVVIVEVANLWGLGESYTVPNTNRFVVSRDPDLSFAGASLEAWVKLGREKGYRLVGVNRHGINAYFVRNDVAPDRMPEGDIRSCLNRPKARAVREVWRGLARPEDWHEV